MHSDFETSVTDNAASRGLFARVVRRVARLVGTGMLLGALAAPALMASGADAHAETRSLKLYFVHTGEKAVITFKRNGVYDRQGLQQLNRFLRDWRRNQPTKMDPRLFDLIWEVYRKSGSNTYVNVVCGFRSPETNSMLRSRSKGVAEKSQHMLGKAMDFFIPDVKLATLRAIGMKMQIGGVGFYPHSGSPFVHMDVGNVRAWPRMSRSELVRLFPNGRTLHIPSDGRPLPGYQEAMVDYKRRVGSNHIEIADTGGSKKKGFFAALFGGGEDDEADSAPAETAVASAAPVRAKEQVLTNPSPDTQPIVAPEGGAPRIAVNAPIPLGRPSLSDKVGNSGVAAALVEPPSNSAAAALAAASIPTDPSAENFPDLKGYNIPVPTLLGKRRQNGDADVETAALSMTEQSADLAAVPVPVSRPSGSEALLAKAEGADESMADEAEQDGLSPDSAAALDQNNAAGPIKTVPETNAKPADDSLVAQSGLDDNEPYTTDEGEDNEEVASLEGQPDAMAPNFGDSFDPPAATDNSPLAQGLPIKGGRPTPKDAALAAEAGKALTGDMLAKWAVNNTHADGLNAAVKAPRFISAAMRAQAEEPVSSGFSTNVATIDPARFSGGAPNPKATNAN